MTTITITTDDLDRLAHALLLAKADYVSTAVRDCHDYDVWQNRKANIEALQSLYDQIKAALLAQVEEV